MKYPALDVSGVDGELLLALLDDFSPAAAEQHDTIVTVFFVDSVQRDHARDEVARARPDATVNARDVDDEDWARRSQEHLPPVTVGRITVTPPWLFANLQHPTSNLQRLIIVIAPSMGFGTGHHATTRLCLAALQTVNFTNGRALDVGTGSGVLAIAARLLGAREAVGIDNDTDAIQAARENLACNPAVDHVRFDVTDLRATPLSRADVITANLTGALLIPSASILLEALEPGGSLIVSGLQRTEREDVVKAFAQARVVWEAEEDGWAALALTPKAESQPRH